jgi:hypothetical protein
MSIHTYLVIRLIFNKEITKIKIFDLAIRVMYLVVFNNHVS